MKSRRYYPWNQLLITLTAYAVISAMPQKSSAAAHEQQQKGLSVLPVIAANSTYGLMLGAAGIYYPHTEYYNKLSAISVFTIAGNLYQVLGYEARKQSIGYGIQGIHSTFFDPYYRNAGYQSYPHEADEIALQKQSLKPYIGIPLGKYYEVQFYTDTRIRKEEKTLNTREGEELKIATFGDDFTTVMGSSLSYVNKIDKRVSWKGRKVELDLHGMPSKGFSKYDKSVFMQWEASYNECLEYSESLFQCHHLAAGYTFGYPTKQFDYRLGGYRLRGFRDDRLFGKHYYINMNELRFDIYKYFTGSLFASLGDVGDRRLERPQYSYGGGIKIDLPPDRVAKLRLDLGRSIDGYNFIMTAEHAF